MVTAHGGAAVAPPRTTGQPEAFGRVENPEPTAPPAKRSRKPVVLLILGIVMVVGVVVGVIWWLDARQYESTDDAFISADVTQVSPRFGHVQTVYVNDNQFVKAGDKIIEIDPKDLQSKVNQDTAAVDSAKAAVQQAMDDAASMVASVGQAKAAEQAAETEAKRAHSELDRFEKLSARSGYAAADDQLSRSSGVGGCESRRRPAEDHLGAGQREVGRVAGSRQASRCRASRSGAPHR